jgi:hypothetical protein
MSRGRDEQLGSGDASMTAVWSPDSAIEGPQLAGWRQTDASCEPVLSTHSGLIESRISRRIL